MLLSAVVLSLAGLAQTAPDVIIEIPKGQPTLSFAAQEIVRALKAKKVAAAIGNGTARHTVTIRIRTGTPESFRIENARHGVNVIGGDLRGAMYGALDVAEQIALGENGMGRWNGKDGRDRKGGKDRSGQPIQPFQSSQPFRLIGPQTESPSMPVRMIKFNIPLPGVGYASEESLRKNGWFYDLDYWRGFLSMMARNRYNALSLWSAHPYDRMLRLSKYPEACALSDEELAKNQKFFHALFQMAKDHGVDIYLMTWNTHVSPAFASAHKIAVNGADSPLVRDYTKECVRELLLQYPEITGLGTCPGEAMGSLNADQRMAFIRETYFEGIKEAVDGKRLTVSGPDGSQVAGRGLRELIGNSWSEVRGPKSKQKSASVSEHGPFVNRQSSIVNRTADRQPSTANPYPPFILRYWGGTPESTDKMLAEAKYPGPVYLDIKFNGEHMYSSAKPHVQNKKWEQMAGKRYKLLWHLRNDDLFTLRWGDPEFAREMLGNVGGKRLTVSGSGTVNRQPSTISRSAGFVMGSEIEIPGEDYIHTSSAAKHKDWKYEFEKHWFKWALWGRLGYNLNEPESTWIKTFEERFGLEAGPKIFSAMKYASKILPTVTAFHWNYMNGDWYPEGNVGPWNTNYEVPRQNFRDNKIFHSVDEWVWNNTIDGSLEDIPTYVMRGLSARGERREAKVAGRGSQVPRAGSPSPLRGRAGVGMSGSRDMRLTSRVPKSDASASRTSLGRPPTRPPTPSLKGGGALTPIEVATKLEAWASTFEKLRPNDSFDYDHANDKEWVCTLDDLKAVSELGHYYSAKILGATSYCRFLLTGDEASRSNSILHLQSALSHWKKLAAIADAHYIEHEVWLQGQFSWGKYTPDAERDVQIVKNAMPLPISERGWKGSAGAFDSKRRWTFATGKQPTSQVVQRVISPSRSRDIESWLDVIAPKSVRLLFPGRGSRPANPVQWRRFDTEVTVSQAATWRLDIKSYRDPRGSTALVQLNGHDHLPRQMGPLTTHDLALQPGTNRISVLLNLWEQAVSVDVELAPMPWRTRVADLDDKSAARIVPPMVAATDSGSIRFLEIPKGSGRGLDLTTNKLKNNGRAEFPVEIKEAGKYVVHANVNWPDTAGNSFYIEFDQPFRPTPLPPVLGNDDSFDNWHWVVSPAFDLKPGIHTLILRNREEGAKVARLVVAKQEGTVSTNNDDGGDLLTAKERNDFFHSIYERMTAVRQLDRFKTKAEWQAYAKEMRPKILNALGLWPLPKKVALDPHNSKKLVRDGYTVERVWYQVFPKVYASAYLYIPDAAKVPGAKLPAILHPHGHWDQGAADPVVQSRCIALAKMGYVGLCPDSTHVFDFPTGLCPVGQMTWDNIRGLDYLESLPYVDKNKLGCTGASGGGQQTMYLGAVDDRVKVLVPAVMVCYFKRILFEDESAHHFCNHVPGIAGWVDQTEMAAMFAPRPTLFICATGDWTLTVPKEEFPDMKHIWDLTGGDAKVVQFDKPHNFDQDSREQMYAWFNKYLKGDSDPAHAKEPALKTEDPSVLKALGGPPAGAAGHEGAVAYYRKATRFKEPGLKTPKDLVAYRAQVIQRLPSGRPDRPAGWDFEPSLSRRPNGFVIAELPGAKWLVGEAIKGMQPTLAVGKPVPAWFFKAQSAKGLCAAVVIAHPGGKRALMAERPWLVKSLVARGIAVLAVDVRYRGELKRDWRWNNLIWGLPEATLAARDLQNAAGVLSPYHDVDPKRIYVVGLGDLGVAALIAAARNPSIAGAAADDIGPTYTAGRETPDLPGLLRYTDLPQIAALAAPRKLWINGAREPFWFTRSAYKLLKADKNLRITTKHDGEFDYSLAGWVLGK